MPTNHRAGAHRGPPGGADHRRRRGERRDDDRVHDGVVAPEPVVLADLAHQLVRLHVVPPAQLRAQAELLPDAERQRLGAHLHSLRGRNGREDRACARKQELDEAALKMLREADPVPGIPDDLGRDTLTLVIPVEYSLITNNSYVE